MKKKLFVILCLSVLIFSFPVYAEQDADEKTRQELSEGVAETLNSLDLKKLEELFNESGFSGKELLPTLKELASGSGDGFTANDFFTVLKNAFFYALKTKLATGIEIVLVFMLLSVLKNLAAEKFGGAARAAFYAGYAIACVLALSIMYKTVATVKGALSEMSQINETLTPLLYALLTGMGSGRISSVMNPLMSVLTGSVFAIVQKAVFPAVLIMTAIAMADNISEQIDLSGFYNAGLKAVKWFLGIVSIVFIAFMTVKGMSGAALDGIYFKTAKYTVEQMIPVVGGMFSDTFDTVMSCGLITANAIGGVATAILAAKLAVPIMSVTADMLIFKAAGAAVLPLGHKNSSKMLFASGNMAELLNITLLICSLMSFISLCLLIGSINISFMMR